MIPGIMAGGGANRRSAAASGDAEVTIVVTLGADNDNTITRSNGNLTATKNGTTGTAYVFATEGKETGKFYFEVSVDALSTQEVNIGLSGGLFLLERANFLGAIGYKSIAINSNTAGVIINNGTDYAASFVQGDILGFAVDVTHGIVWISKNGTYLSGNPAAGTGGTVTAVNIPKAWYPTAYLHGANSAVTFNFGATAFAHAPPAGFSAWNVSSPQTDFATFRSALMWIRSLGNFSHAAAEIALCQVTLGANLLAGATVTSSAAVTLGSLSMLNDGLSNYAAWGSTGVNAQAPAYVAFEHAANAARNALIGAVQAPNSAGAEAQTPRLFDWWLSTGTVAGGIWYRSTALGVTLPAFVTNERKEFAL